MNASRLFLARPPAHFVGIVGTILCTSCTFAPADTTPADTTTERTGEQSSDLRISCFSVCTKWGRTPPVGKPGFVPKAPCVAYKRVCMPIPPPLPPVMSRFKVNTDGFRFVNSFVNHAGDITTNGLCGGMVYTALDYYNSNLSIPSQTVLPQDGTQLQSYIFGRNMDEIESNLVGNWSMTINPFGWNNSSEFNNGITDTYFGALISAIDSGNPIPLGLLGTQGTGNHVVLAIGYDPNTYSGDFPTITSPTLRIFIYDPNYPDQQRTLVPDVGGQFFTEAEAPGQEKWVTYFVDTNYTVHAPIPASLLNNPLTYPPPFHPCTSRGKCPFGG